MLTWSRHIIQKWMIFHKDHKGIAAVEFAMVVPLMVGMYMGAVEVGQALVIDRKLNSLAGATADLVTQTQTVTTAEVKDIFKITDAILAPYDKSTLKIIVSSVVADVENKQAVAWSVSNKTGAEHAVGSTIPGMGKDVTEANSSVIVAEVEYTYQSPVSYYFTGDTKLTEMLFTRPRKSLTVELSD